MSRRAPTRRPARALLAAALLCAAGCSRGPPKPNLLIVSFDTLRADRLGVYGNSDWDESPSPVVDSLAARGTVFDTAVAPRGQTHPALGSLLTGKYPITTGLRENGLMLLPQHTTLFEQLQRAGWATGVFIANFDRSHPLDNWIFRGADRTGDGFQGRRAIEARQESRFQRQWDDRVEQAALDFLDDADPGRPFAAWVHFYDVHKPYNPPDADVARYGLAADTPDVLRAPGEDSGPALEAHLAEITLGERPVPASDALRRILGLYDGGIRATDRRLGRLLDRLSARGLAETTYLVFTSDHGEELFDHNRYFFHGNSVYQGVLRIPLVVAGPGLPAGRRLAQPVQTVDISPTLLDLLGVPPLPGAEGASLAPLLRGETTDPPRPYAFIEWQDLVYAVTDGRWKYMQNPLHAHPLKAPFHMTAGQGTARGFSIECFEAYDLQADPLEQADRLAGADPAAYAEPAALPAQFQPLRRALDRWLADPRHERSMSWPGQSQDAIDRMKELGYVGGGPADRSDVLFREPCAPR